MTQGMRRWLLVVNYCAALFFGVAWQYLLFAPPLLVSRNVTELDRRGVINEAKLKEMDPQLGEDVRGKLGPWIAEEALRSGVHITQIGLVITIANLVTLHIAGLGTGRKATATPPEDH
jgi:hypothetical protein